MELSQALLVEMFERPNKVLPSEDAPLCKRIYDYSTTRILIY